MNKVSTVRKRQRPPQTVVVPEDVIKALRAESKKHLTKTDFGLWAQMQPRTLDAILEKKTCGYKTLGKLYELTGIENPEKQTA